MDQNQQDPLPFEMCSAVFAKVASVCMWTDKLNLVLT